VNKETLPILSAQDWALFGHHLKRAEYQRGAVILAEGIHHRRALYFVISGTVRVEQAQDGHGLALALLGPGEIFGEMGFVEEAPGSASVVAQDNTVIDVIDGEALQSIMASEPGLAVRFYHSIAIALMHRLRATSRRLAQAGTGEVAQIGRFRTPRTGNISARQIPLQLSGGLDEFERTILSIKQEIRAGALSEEDARARVEAICEGAVEVLRRFTRSEPLMEMGWSDLLAFRDPSHLAAGVGDYVFRETFRTVMLSATMARCYAKPRGFPDDHETIAAIYANAPEGDDHLGPLIDRWFLNRPICRSRRASRDLMQATLMRLVKSWPGGESVRVASLASGAAAELLNLCETPEGASIRATCVDIDGQALLAAARRGERSGLTERLILLQGSAVASDGEGISLPPQHLIYALGLCEYLSDEQVVSVLDQSNAALIPGGTVVITNLNSTSPDRELMEHILDWKANHRTADELRSLFARSKFGQQPVEIFADETEVTLFARCTKAA
jgi:extracellular factor (EF) 3-hydroxypalmitic acid methyl ester biosynthesis protein